MAGRFFCSCFFSISSVKITSKAALIFVSLELTPQSTMFWYATGISGYPRADSSRSDEFSRDNTSRPPCRTNEPVSLRPLHQLPLSRQRDLLNRQSLACDAVECKVWEASRHAEPPPAHWFFATYMFPPTAGALNSKTRKGQ